MKMSVALALNGYQVGDILPADGALTSANAGQGDMLVEIAASESWTGDVIATMDQFQSELLPSGTGNILVRHASHGPVGIYTDNSLGVRKAWAEIGLSAALVANADHALAKIFSF